MGLEPKLGIVAGLLVLTGIGGCTANDADEMAPAVIGLLSFIFLAELPGAWRRLRGASFLEASALTFGLPLLLFEGWLLFDYLVNCPCGHKEVQPFLMVFVVPPVVLVTGWLVLGIAGFVRRRSEPE